VADPADEDAGRAARADGWAAGEDAVDRVCVSEDAVDRVCVSEDAVDRVRAGERGTRAVPTWKGGWVQDPAAAEVQAPGGGEAATDAEACADGPAGADGEASAMAERGGADAGPRVR
jgi:hypothetical protein